MTEVLMTVAAVLAELNMIHKQAESLLPGTDDTQPALQDIMLRASKISEAIMSNHRPEEQAYI